MFLVQAGKLIKLQAGKTDQYWKPNEGLTAEQVLQSVNYFVDEDKTNLGRALVALKRLATIVNVDQDKSLEDPKGDSPDQSVDPTKAPAVAGEPLQEANGTKPDNKPEGTGLNTDAVKTEDPKADQSQQPRGPAPDDVDSLEKQGKEPVSSQILNHDAVVTLHEFDEAHTLNEDFDVAWEETVRGLEVTLNGVLYIYEMADGSPIDQITDRFERIAKHSKGRAVSWLESQRRAGVIKSTKINPEAESPNKQWTKLVKDALGPDTTVNVIPQEDDWLAEFSNSKFTGSISANLYAGDWWLQWTGVSDDTMNGELKGVGKDDLAVALTKLKS